MRLRVLSTSRKTRFASKFNLTCVRGDRGCRNTNPGDVAETRGFALRVPKAKKFKRLATRDTLHGSCPNLRQREPDGRIVPTPSDVSAKGASTKRCARRKKKRRLYINLYILVRLSHWYAHPYVCGYLPPLTAFPRGFFAEACPRLACNHRLS